MDDRGKYLSALEMQKLRAGIANMLKAMPPRKPFGPAGETCLMCGGPVETYPSNKGRHPIRGCWDCELDNPDEKERGW